MSRDRRLGVRRLRRHWEDDELEPKLGGLPAPTITAPWSQAARELLARGEVVALQPILAGSNYTFLASLSDGRGAFCLAVYKPRRGEAPLWDFPEGSLYRREYAAYLVSQALGWPFIPPTVIRDGPYGIGSLQFFVAPGQGDAFFALRGQHRAEICRITLFDHLANNADRKPGHFIRDDAGQIWGIDHGLTFNEDWKLRTVVFDFCGQPIPPDLLRDLEALRSGQPKLARLEADLSSLLTPGEIAALVARISALLSRRTFPELDPYYNVPRGFF